MKEKQQNRARTVIALALIVILFFSAVGNVARLLFAPVVRTAVHHPVPTLHREFSQEDWETFNRDMENLGRELDVLGEELGQMGEEINEEINREMEQLDQELEREMESIEREVNAELEQELEVGR